MLNFFFSDWHRWCSSHRCSTILQARLSSQTSTANAIAVLLQKPMESGGLRSIARRHRLCHGPSSNSPLLFVLRLSSASRPTFTDPQAQPPSNSFTSTKPAFHQPLSAGRSSQASLWWANAPYQLPNQPSSSSGAHLSSARRHVQAYSTSEILGGFHRTISEVLLRALQLWSDTGAGTVKAISRGEEQNADEPAGR